MAADVEGLVQVRNLRKYFPITAGVLRRKVGEVRAVDDVSFSISEGETLGLVGESGCGKSTTGRLLLRLIEPTTGEVEFEGRDIISMGKGDLRRQRREMQLIFQDPNSSLHPRMTVGELIGEPMWFHRLYKTKAEVRGRVDELMQTVGLSVEQRDRYAHQFSGGQRQRIGIARALAVNPKFLVCDEPVSALDVSIQAQVINLLHDLQEEFGLSYLLISHDLSVVRYVTDRVAVMYLGKIVEIGDTDDLFGHPMHPYTEALISAIPFADPRINRGRERIILQGDVPSPANPPSGCNFHPRCPYVIDRCLTEEPPLQSVVGIDGTARSVACHRSDVLDLQGTGTLLQGG